MGSYYGKPNKTVQLDNVDCSGSETTLDDCNKVYIPPDSGRNLYRIIDAAGVTCLPPVGTSTGESTGGLSGNSGYIGMGVLGALLVIAILVAIRYI